MGRQWLLAAWAGLSALLAALLSVVSALAIDAVPSSWRWAHNGALLTGVTVALVLAAVAVAVIQARSSGNRRESSDPAVRVGKIRVNSVVIGVATQAPEVPKWPDPTTTSVRLLREVTDPFVLEVHRPVHLQNLPPGLPMLPAYVLREHDSLLGTIVKAAAEGRSGIAVLVGGSSTGKTRACWEALQPLRDRAEPWRLWHPIDPSRPEAALRELRSIGPRTVVWLNEAQFYLDVIEGGLGERLAAGLREMLRDPGRAPVLVLATLWPQFWTDLTARPQQGAPDSHAQARELLGGQDIPVPAAFTRAQVKRIGEARDTRLVQASRAQDGQVIQFLAGAPELLSRYRNAPPAATALIHAAMDARRLGMGAALPEAFLEAAAPSYMARTEWNALGDHWLEEALAYSAVPCKGARGPLTRIDLPALGSSGRGSDGQLAGSQTDSRGGHRYRLADYLDQYGQQHRRDQIPPAGFWAAAAAHALPSDKAALGAAAHARGLYRDSAQLNKNAAAGGNRGALSWLSKPPRYLQSEDRALSWAVAHVPLDDPGAVASVLDSLRQTGAADQVTALADRAAPQVQLDDARALVALLESLRKAGTDRQIVKLLRRDPAAQIPLGDPVAVALLLDKLREMGAADQAMALADRAAVRIPLDDPSAVGALLRHLLRAGAPNQAAALGQRAVTAVPLENPLAVAALLDCLQEMGAEEQVTMLAERAAASVPLAKQNDVALLLDSLRKAGKQTQAITLVGRAADARIQSPYGAGFLLVSLQRAGALDQTAALAKRVAADVPLDNLQAVSWLLGYMRTAGAVDQAEVLAGRAVRDAPLDEPRGVGWLLEYMALQGASRQAGVLLRRDPAAHVSLGRPSCVADLLEALCRVGANRQAVALAKRAVAHVPLDDPGALVDLMETLWQELADRQVTVLLRRDPAAHVRLDEPRDVARFLNNLKTAVDQVEILADRAADHVPTAHASDVAELLRMLRAAGADRQAEALVDRLPGAGMFELYCEQRGRVDLLRYGQQSDGSPAGPWRWQDLE